MANAENGSRPARASFSSRGDYVKTSANGSAEIVFLDGTLYTVRPNTLFLVTRQAGIAGAATEQQIAMEYGWVNLNTAQRGGRVTTPRAEALVGRESDVVVSYDKASSTGRFSAFRGSLEVASNAGLKRTVAELEQVVQTGDLLSDPRRLPTAPEPEQPIDNLEVSLAAVKTLVLAWKPVDLAARYALQVSRSRLFVDNVIDVDARTKPRPLWVSKARGPSNGGSRRSTGMACRVRGARRAPSGCSRQSVREKRATKPRRSWSSIRSRRMATSSSSPAAPKPARF